MTEEAKHAELKEKLDALNQRKEDAFRRKQDISGKIAEKIKQVGEFKKSRNDLTRNVRELKVERDKLNTQITSKIAELKAHQPAKVEQPTGPRGERIHPGELSRQIKAMEHKIETVPMSFDAEQKVMKQIKQLRKQLEGLNVARGMSAEMQTKSKEIDALKKSANELHAKVTQMAKESQDHHEKLITLSKEIEELKTQEETVYQEFLAAKQEYLAISGEVKEVQQEARAIRQAERAEKEKQKKEQQAEDQKTLQERAREAEAKMNRGEKLTTEDLLALQSLKD